MARGQSMPRAWPVARACQEHGESSKPRVAFFPTPATTESQYLQGKVLALLLSVVFGVAFCEGR
eukprot:8210879-Lingulodinium_polyedra.AAC.1